MSKKLGYMWGTSFKFPNNYRFIIFRNGRKETYSFREFFNLEFSCMHPLRFNIWQREDHADKWLLTQDYNDPPYGWKNKPILEGVSACFLACWMAKHYRDQYLDVGCFVEEVSL